MGFELDREILHEKLKQHIPSKFIEGTSKAPDGDIKQMISVATMYFAEENQIFMDSFFKKYGNQKVTGYMEKLFVKETKKNIFIVAEVILLGKMVLCLHQQQLLTN